MAPKRKRDLLDFDPNKSDPEDENFDPSVEKPPRSRKKSRSEKRSRAHARRRGRKYQGSDIEEDDDLSDSDHEDFLDDDDDGGGDDGEEDEEEPPINQNTGRRTRRAAMKQTNFYESPDDDGSPSDASDDKDELHNTPQQPKKSKIIKVKVPPGSLRKMRTSAANPVASTRRSTRARTAEADENAGDEELVELSNSGKHARPARGSKSKSPEAAGRGRALRGGKGLKEAPSPIKEASQEDGPSGENVGEQDEMDVENAEEPVADDNGDPSKVDDADEDADEADQQDEPMETVEANEEGDDDDDVPITRRTRARANANATVGDAEDDAEGPGGSRRRLTRRSRTKKSQQEPSSDFEPGNESEEDNESGSGGEKKDNEGDDDSSSPSARGRKSSRGKGRNTRRSRRRSASGDDVQLDKEEMAEELEDLREDSQPVRRRARHSPEILFEEKRKRRTKKVDYSILPLNQANFEVEEEEVETQATPARRRGRAAASGYVSRSLLTTAGPFGGVSTVGDASLFDGPWGNGGAAAAGNADSDSSDDEMGARSGPAGSAALGSLAAPGQGGSEGIKGIAAPAPNVGKVKDHKALADADPLGVDLNVNFSQVGGMEGHIDQLKEMVQLPLLYPEMFVKFHVTPPRGVLFHGPPGTGKTLLARALANSVGIGGRKITFYMRKGADALSKWVGEAEKQLRLLFEEARKTQPSIIFFDEIDGLAPVRSSKQEQIHASIVSTLLALMDGMDGRGQVIVIGATNRPDNIDPALRRPGRFDREFYFPLPDADARKAIIDIHTKDWGLTDAFKLALSKETKGYGGADLRAMCTEAALNAIQRTYPQIYFSKEKLVVDPDKVIVQMTDFILAKKQVIPSSERSSTSGAAPLPKTVEPLLRDQFASITTMLDRILPRKKKTTALQEAMFEPYQDDDFGFEREALHQEFEMGRVFRPRLLICGAQGMGQSYLTAALQHYLEGVHIQNFDLATVLGDVRPPEQVLVDLFREVKRHKPSVIFIPNIDAWYPTLSGSAVTAFLGMLRSVQPTDPVLVLGIAETEFKTLGSDLKRDLFGFSTRNATEIARPVKENREEYFTRIITHIRRLPKDFPNPEGRKKRQLEELPVAPPPPPRVLTKQEQHAEKVRYHQYLNQLKLHLQPIMDQISKKYRNFRNPVIPQSQYQYLLDEAEPNFVRPDVANAPPRPFEASKDDEGTPVLRSTENPKLYFYNIEVGTMEERLANGYYYRPGTFLKDVFALKHDARAIGDRARYLKASELLSNVEVDVSDIEAKFEQNGVDFDYMYEVLKRRALERQERARKKAAMQSVLDSTRSEGGHGEGSTQNGSNEDSLHTTTAQFQVISDVPNAGDESSASHAATNGTSAPSGFPGDDVQMLDAAKDLPGRPISAMQPPSQWPSMPTRPLDSSTRATTGGTSRYSQVSAVQSLPAGVSPSALANDASTTKTPSTQQTNGVHQEHSSPSEHLQDTLPWSQKTSSDDQWPHSQAQGLVRGEIQPPSTSTSSRNQTSPATNKTIHPTSMANLLNDPSPEETPQSQGQSQQVDLDENSAQFLLDELTKRTSGCTIEQLEQINHELMSELWRTRGEHNRMKVHTNVARIFNEAINDIEMTQKVMQSSQDINNYSLSQGEA
ncbi:hypothetical protein F4780DRAFT_470095 [Xylariomycetidae sp. FL0641]|nr:hypothetical protein F4780DRAFT_470095 [Xylariomycetidae sp. FL0641]